MQTHYYDLDYMASRARVVGNVDRGNRWAERAGVDCFSSRVGSMRGTFPTSFHSAARPTVDAREREIEGALPPSLGVSSFS